MNVLKEFVYHIRKGLAWFVQWILGTALIVVLLATIVLYNTIQPEEEEKFIP